MLFVVSSSNVLSPSSVSPQAFPWEKNGTNVGCVELRLCNGRTALSCCFLGQETLLCIVSLHPGVEMATGDILLSVTL